MVEQRARVLDVLDRLEEDDGVERLLRSPGLDEVAREAQVLAPVAQARVLVGLGVGVDADHRGGAAREHLRAVALAAGHVDDPPADRARGDPLVDREVPAVPVVLLRHVGQRALPRQLERRDPGRLVLLDEGVGGHGRASIFPRLMPPPATAERIRDVNVRYHDAAAAEYDAKWGIDFGEVGHRQVIGKLRKALGGELEHFPRSLEIGSGTGYFSLNLLQAGVIGSAVCTDISPGMLDTLQANAARLGLDVRTVACEAEALPFEDRSFDLVLGHAVLHHLPDLPAAFAEFWRVLAPGRHGRASPASPRATATASRRCPSAAPRRSRRCGGRWSARAPRRPTAAATCGGHEDGHQLERYVDVHAFVPGDLAELARGAGFEDVRVRGEELLANLFGWFNRGVEATAEPEDVPWAWRQYAYRGYLALQQRRRAAARVAPARRRSSTT